MKREHRASLVSSLAWIVLAVFILLPILWGILLSFKSRVDALSIPPVWLFTPTLDNYRAAFVSGPFSRTIVNSLFIATVSSIVAMAMAIPAAYALSRARIVGKEASLLAVLTVRMTPAAVIALPF